MLLTGIRAVVLDAVGTLIYPDPPAPVVYAEVGRQWGTRHDAQAIKSRFLQAFEREDQIDRALGWRTSEQREIKRWHHIVAQVLDDVSDPEACFHKLFDHFSRPEAWRCEPDTGPVLTKLAERGLVLGMASNYDSRLRKVLAGKPELQPIQHVIISAEVGWRKPAAEFFAAVCRNVALPGDHILVVGDDLINDVQGAQTAGLRALWFDRKDRKTSTGSICIKELSELVN